MDKRLFLALSIISIVLIGGCTQQQTPPVKKQSFTLEQVSEHSTINDCWLVIDGSVYDVTDFVSNHPGGDVILEGCGKDATEFFETRPMGSGTPHSQNARTIRENYYIGDLV